MLRLKEFRDKIKKTQTEVAKITQIPLRNYNHYENGITQPDIDTLCKLADFYNCSLDELVGRESSLINVAILTNTQQEIIKRVQNMSDKEQEYTLLYLKMRSNEL